MKHATSKKAQIAVCAACMLGIIASLPAQAGKKHKWKKEAISIGNISGGIHFFDFENLNDALTTNGLEEFNEYAPALTFSHYMGWRRFISTGELNFMFWRSGHAHNHETDLWASSIVTQAGINLLPPDLKFDIYPLAGLGLGLLKLSNHEYKRSFSEALNSEGYSAVLWQSTLLVDVGTAMFISIDMKRGMKHKEPKTLVLGLRAGYRIDVLDQDEWLQHTGSDIITGPDPSMSGAYVGLTLGKAVSYEKHGRGK
ncbi:MAG: hypothetical protein GF350_10955 [Chitinivibrionales bacterium]|nr:hypothetical protein [Chitinivibrionales bacterium]